MTDRRPTQQTILNVDLTARRVWEEPVPAEDAADYIGGRGINAKLLYERVPRGTDPMDPENRLIVGTGALNGTLAPCSGRITVTTKSPATGLYLKSSAGGHFGAELKRAGFDYLVISGASETPVYLWIHDGEAEIRPADHLWGKGTRETDSRLKEALEDPKVQTAVIGPAGENGVLFANINVSRYNFASRGGVGAVMGSKGLKGVAVRGHATMRPEDDAGFKALSKQIRGEIAEDGTATFLHMYGTSGFIPGLDAAGLMPSRNFGQGQIEGAERLSGQHVEEAGYLKGRKSCHACQVGCHRHVQFDSEEYGSVDDVGPELEAVMSLGAQCGATETEAVLKANELCNDFGMDVISVGHVIAWAMETCEKGLIDAKDLEGMDLAFGNVRAELELIGRIATREGRLGNLLADGIERAAETVGGDSWKWAIQSKGLEQSACDTRVAKGYALAFALNPRGPDHLTTQIMAEFGMSDEAKALIKQITGDENLAVPNTKEKRAEIVLWHENLYAMNDCLGICTFVSSASFVIGFPHMAGLYGLATGTDATEASLSEAGRRVVTLERMFNVREGYTREKDALPYRMMHEPVAEGPMAGHVTPASELQEMLDEYFELNGWDPATGIPGRQALERLQLQEVCA
jgi:aldehyde:ferredoxin oxidoreductase